MVINSSASSFKSFHSALSTPDTSTFEDTLVDSLTPFNLAEHCKECQYILTELLQVIQFTQFSSQIQIL